MPDFILKIVIICALGAVAAAIEKYLGQDALIAFYSSAILMSIWEK